MTRDLVNVNPPPNPALERGLGLRSGGVVGSLAKRPDTVAAHNAARAEATREVPPDTLVEALAEALVLGTPLDISYDEAREAASTAVDEATPARADDGLRDLLRRAITACENPVVFPLLAKQIRAALATPQAEGEKL